VRCLSRGFRNICVWLWVVTLSLSKGCSVGKGRIFVFENYMIGSYIKPMYVYILECADGSYYTGVTNNLERRMLEHSNGVDKFCYTYTRLPIKLVYHQFFSDPNQAIMWEKKIKGWSRAKKKALMNENYELLVNLSKSKQPTPHPFDKLRVTTHGNNM